MRILLLAALLALAPMGLMAQEVSQEVDSLQVLVDQQTALRNEFA